MKGTVNRDHLWELVKQHGSIEGTSKEAGLYKCTLASVLLYGRAEEKTLRKLSKVLGVPLEEFATLDEKKSKPIFRYRINRAKLLELTMASGKAATRLSTEAGLTPMTLKWILLNENSKVNRGTLEKLAKVFEVPQEELLAEEAS